MRLLTRAVFFALLIYQLAPAQQSTRTIYLVRHAEATSAAPDASLSPTGEKRADCLAKTLKDAGIKQIFVTDAKRTQQTAAPLAKALNLTPKIVPAKDPSTMIRDILYSGGGNILVVSHSDALPFILGRMKAGIVPAIDANEYDRLFVSTVIEGNATQASTLRYCDCGAANPAPPSTKTPHKKVTTNTKKK